MSLKSGRASSPFRSIKSPKKNYSPVKVSMKPTSSILANGTYRDRVAALELVNRSHGNIPVSTIDMIDELNNDLKHQDKDIEIERLQTAVYSQNNRISLTEDDKLEIDQLKRRLAESETLRLTQQKKIEDLQSERETLMKTRALQEEQIAKYEASREDYERRKRQHEQELTTLSHSRAQLDKEVDQLQESNNGLRLEIESVTQQKSKLKQELDVATQYIDEMEKKIYKCNKHNVDLQAAVTHKEIQMNNLASLPYWHEYRTKWAYNPVSVDPVDVKLAEFINSHPQRPQLSFLFKRVFEGVYEFGQKKVTMAVKQNQLMIRVGGGWLTPDDFVEQYLPIELAREGTIDRLGKIWTMEDALYRDASRRSAASRSRSPKRSSPNRSSIITRKSMLS